MVCQNPASLVSNAQVRSKFTNRIQADIDKDATKICLASFTCLDILEGYASHFTFITMDAFHHRIPDKANLFVGKGAILKHFLSSQLIATVNDGHTFCKARQENSFLYRRVPTTDNQQIFITEKCAITDRTVRNPAAVVVFLARNPQMTMIGTRSNDDRFSFKTLIFCDDFLKIASVFNFFY